MALVDVADVDWVRLGVDTVADMVLSAYASSIGLDQRLAGWRLASYSGFCKPCVLVDRKVSRLRTRPGELQVAVVRLGRELPIERPVTPLGR